jgi:hypothetical protein
MVDPMKDSLSPLLKTLSDKTNMIRVYSEILSDTFLLLEYARLTDAPSLSVAYVNAKKLGKELLSEFETDKSEEATMALAGLEQEGHTDLLS